MSKKKEPKPDFMQATVAPSDGGDANENIVMRIKHCDIKLQNFILTGYTRIIFCTLREILQVTKSMDSRLRHYKAKKKKFVVRLTVLQSAGSVGRIFFFF